MKKLKTKTKKNNNSTDIDNKKQLYLITRKAIPDVFINVLKVKDLIENKNENVATATHEVGISRTTYYKYCDDIFYYNEAPQSKTISLSILINDKVGIMSKITKVISNNDFSIVTINQLPPINDNTMITLTIVMASPTCNLSKLIYNIQKLKDIKDVKIKSLK